MTDTNVIEQKPKLGVGAIISESFSLLFKNIVPIAIASIIPIVLSLLVSGGLLGFGVLMGTEAPNFAGGAAFVVAYLLTIVVGFMFYGLIIAMLVQLAYDAKLGRPKDYGRYFSAALATIVPNMIMTLIVTILAGIGFVLLLIPGLWIMAFYAVIIPALVIERVGFGAMGRSQTLTKDYRWPVMGAFILVWICAMVLNTGIGMVAGLVGAALGAVGIIISLALMALVYVFTYGLMSVAVSLIYARLREIKEGVGIDELASVFE